MKSELAIYLSDCLKEVDGIYIHWRIIKAYGDNFETDDKKLKELMKHDKTTE